jgi:uncharacterized protein
MVDEYITEVIARYVRAVESHGIPVAFSVLHGSYAKGRADKWSDIDLVVVSPAFDPKATWEQLRVLSRIGYEVDVRIEPVPCGERQWVEDDERIIIEVARREGQRIDQAEVA